MENNLGVILIFVHLTLAACYSVIIYLKKSYLRTDFILVIFLIPITGILAALIVELVNYFNLEDTIKVELPELTLGDDTYWKSIKGSTEDRDLIPLEEAIFINDTQVRRRLVLDTLYDDPMKYLDVLLTARYNDDVETAHYATTTISKAQRDFQLKIQEYLVHIEEESEDIRALDELIDLLGAYIDSGLLEDYLLTRQRIQYGILLDKKLSVVGKDKDTLIKKLRNNLAMKDYGSAEEISEMLKNYWYDDEQTWIEALRVSVEGRDRKKLKETILEIEIANVDWTNYGRQQLAQWVKV
jgi:hypothetical protein